MITTAVLAINLISFLIFVFSMIIILDNGSIHHCDAENFVFRPWTMPGVYHGALCAQTYSPVHDGNLILFYPLLTDQSIRFREHVRLDYPFPGDGARISSVWSVGILGIDFGMVTLFIRGSSVIAIRRAGFQIRHFRTTGIRRVRGHLIQRIYLVIILRAGFQVR